MDYSLFKAINGLSGASLPDDIFTQLAKNMPAVLVVVVALVFLFRWRSNRMRRRNGAVLATVSAALAQLVNQPISHAVARPRPYVAHPAHVHLLIARSQDFSFPSDHATAGFALATGIWLYDRTLGTVLLVFAAVLAFARVYVGTHYPGDVVAGAVIGSAVSLLLFAPPLRRQLERVARGCSNAWDHAFGNHGPAPASHGGELTSSSVRNAGRGLAGRDDVQCPEVLGVAWTVTGEQRAPGDSRVCGDVEIRQR